MAGASSKRCISGLGEVLVERGNAARAGRDRQGVAYARTGDASLASPVRALIVGDGAEISELLRVR